MRNVDQVTAQIENAIQGNLTEEQHDEIELWIKGRSLATTVATPGWEVVLDMLQAYVADSIQRLMAIDPADTNSVLAEQSVAFAANKIVRRLVEDVQNAVEASRRTPEIAKKAVSPIPPESIG